jgi:hypothetical protein
VLLERPGFKTQKYTTVGPSGWQFPWLPRIHEQ